MSPLSWRRAVGLLAAAALGLLTAGCGGSPAADEAQPVNQSAPLHSELPAEQRQAGRIVVGSDIAYPPMEYYDTDGTTVIGFDKDLADAIGRRLGVRMEFRNATFDGLITALRSGRIDIVMSGMSDTKERQQSVDFVDYYIAGAVLLVQKGNPAGLKSLDDLCGRRIAVQRGTTQEGYAQDQSEKCVGQGKQRIEILSFDRETEAMLQVRQGRAVAGLQDYPVAAHNARTAGEGAVFDVVGNQIEAGPLGIAVAKDNPELREAIRKALEDVVKSGEYQRLVNTWEMPDGAIPNVTVNAGT